MNDHHFDQLLRKKLPPETPAPGFETKLKTLVKEQMHSPVRSWWKWAMAAAIPITCVILALVFLKSEEKPTPPVVIISPPELSDTYPALAHSPLHQELDALQTDASRTLQFLSDRFPSLPQTF